MVVRTEKGKSPVYKLHRNTLRAVGVKSDVLVSFFIKGENQEEGSDALERRMKKWKGW